MFKGIIFNKIQELEKLRQLQPYKSNMAINKDLERVLFEEEHKEESKEEQHQQIRKSQVIFKHYENRHLRREIKFVNKF
jgi:hypothetical protein